MTDVVALLSHQGRQTAFARALSSALCSRDIGLLARTYRELVADVTIQQSVGNPPDVDPDRPLLWLSPGDLAPSLSPDERFLAAETHAAARSVALLTRSPVLNRPSPVGACGLFPPSSAIAVRRVRQIPDLNDAVRAEGFTGTQRADADGTEQYDYSTGVSSFGSGSDPVGPFRHRPAAAHTRLVKVTVVGTWVRSAISIPPATLDASVRIAAFFELDLATVWWLIEDTTAVATLARIDCWISDFNCGGGVDEVAVAVAEWLAARLSARTPAQATR